MACLILSQSSDITPTKSPVGRFDSLLRPNRRRSASQHKRVNQASNQRLSVLRMPRRSAAKWRSPMRRQMVNQPKRH